MIETPNLLLDDQKTLLILSVQFAAMQKSIDQLLQNSAKALTSDDLPKLVLRHEFDTLKGEIATLTAAVQSGSMRGTWKGLASVMRDLTSISAGLAVVAVCVGALYALLHGIKP